LNRFKITPITEEEKEEDALALTMFGLIISVFWALLKRKDKWLCIFRFWGLAAGLSTSGLLWGAQTAG